MRYKDKREIVVSIDKASEHANFGGFLHDNIDLFNRVRECDRILVKINLPFWTTPPGSLTKAETLLDLRSFLRKVFPCTPVFIVESRYGWVPVKVLQEYGIGYHDVIDFFERPTFFTHETFAGLGGKHLNIPLTKEVKNPKNFLITIGPPKTHEFVIYTGAVKTKMGFLRMKKRHVHGITKIEDMNNPAKWDEMVKCLHMNLVTLNDMVKVDVSILDGTECMEGEGPVHGTRVNWDLWAISNNEVALDYVMTILMGLEPHEIAYLWQLMEDREELRNDLDDFFVSLNVMEKYGRNFKPPANISDELRVSKALIREWSGEVSYWESLSEQAKEHLRKCGAGYNDCLKEDRIFIVCSACGACVDILDAKKVKKS